MFSSCRVKKESYIAINSKVGLFEVNENIWFLRRKREQNDNDDVNVTKRYNISMERVYKTVEKIRLGMKMKWMKMKVDVCVMTIQKKRP